MSRGASLLLAAFAAVLTVPACSGNGTPAPTGPSSQPRATTAPATTTGATTSSATAKPGVPGATTAVPSTAGRGLPGDEAMLTQNVAFPPRNEPLLFRQSLEAKYRDGLRRGSTSSFVDIEGTIVWTQEYLRYRVNQCGHSDAVFRVFRQIDGFGVQPVCSNTESVVFPPRNEPFDFRLQLESKYRDGLRRGPSATFVDTEGDIVWTQEYLRYRVSGCLHFDSQDKVFAQIDGRGVQPDCRPVPPPPPPPPDPNPPRPPGTGAFVEFLTDSRTCNCTVGTIRLIIDGGQVGSMGCRDSRRFSVSPGTRTVEACDNSGCWPRRSETLRQNETLSVTLTCSGGITTANGTLSKVCLN